MVTKATGAGRASSTLESQLADLRSRDGQVRQKARRALTRAGKRVVADLIPLLNDRKDDVRWEAAKTLADIADARAASALVATLEDENFDVRWLAAEGLIAIGRESVVPLLEGLIERSGSLRLRMGVHHVLHDLATPKLKNLLAPVLAALETGNAGFVVQGPARKALRVLRG